MNIKRSIPLIGAALLTAGSAAADTHKPLAEILHWWSSPGEAAALDVLIEEFEARGGEYYDSTQDNQVENRQKAIERMGKGYPSSLTQWNAGREVREFYDLGLTDAITSPEIIEKLENTLPDPVLNAVTHEGKIVAMPVNIHSENWMWYSNELLDYSDQLVSGDWQQFLDAAANLDEQNLPILAVGDQSWQVRILFTSLFLGISRDKYRTFFLDPENSVNVTESAEFKRVLNVFSKIATYSKSFGEGNWDTQVKAVAENKAAATFMGDWAKGEFQSLGKDAGDHYGCALSGGADPSLLLVIDAFILGKMMSPAERSGQELMLDVISDPDVNRKFNKLKGSVSPYASPVNADRDVCSDQVYKTIAKDDSVIPPYASYLHGHYMHQIDNEIYRLWKAAQENGVAEVEASVKMFREITQALSEEASRAVATAED